MKTHDYITEFYAQSVSGIKNDWFVNDPIAWYNYIINIPKKQQITYCIVTLHNQVINGGFDQYFINGYGKFARSTIYSLNEIHAVNKSNIVQESIDLLSTYLTESESNLVVVSSESLKFVLDIPEVMTQLDKLTDVYNYETEEINELLNTYLSSK